MMRSIEELQKVRGIYRVLELKENGPKLHGTGRRS